MLITSLFAATKHKNDTALVRLSFHFFAFSAFCYSEGYKYFFCDEPHDHQDSSMDKC